MTIQDSEIEAIAKKWRSTFRGGHIMATDAVTVTRPTYTVTLQCPVCHAVLPHIPHDGVNTCDQCGATFVIKTCVGPTETKSGVVSR